MKGENLKIVCRGTHGHKGSQIKYGAMDAYILKLTCILL